MTPEGLVGTGIGGRTPLTGWGGVQIVGWIADWTPVGGWRGVQIGVVGRIGRLLGVGAASRLEMYS